MELGVMFVIFPATCRHGDSSKCMLKYLNIMYVGRFYKLEIIS